MTDVVSRWYNSKDSRKGMSRFFPTVYYNFSVFALGLPSHHNLWRFETQEGYIPKVTHRFTSSAAECDSVISRFLAFIIVRFSRNLARLRHRPKFDVLNYVSSNLTKSTLEVVTDLDHLFVGLHFDFATPNKNPYSWPLLLLFRGTIFLKTFALPS